MLPFRSLVRPKRRLRPKRSGSEEASISSKYPTLEDKLAALRTETDALDRHFLYEAIVRETFRLRHDDHKMRQLCERIGMEHLREFPRIAARLRREIGYGHMPPVFTFQAMGALMTEWGAYQKAVDIYEMALRYGIDDDTEGGFRRKITALHRLMRHGAK
ncbi:MAG: hypothetical protein GX161_06005 [Firmicutes bacterium]|jgi:hypothetical protein|nr:hypothetical protein [Bacillota bacterium]